MKNEIAMVEIVDWYENIFIKISGYIFGQWTKFRTHKKWTKIPENKRQVLIWKSFLSTLLFCIVENEFLVG